VKIAGVVIQVVVGIAASLAGVWSRRAETTLPGEEVEAGNKAAAIEIG
jgi:hypothetical protein